MQIQGRGGCNDYSNTGMLWLKIYKDPWCTLFLVLKSLHFKVISIKHLLLNSHQLNLRIMSRNKVLSQVHRSRIKMGDTKKEAIVWKSKKLDFLFVCLMMRILDHKDFRMNFPNPACKLFDGCTCRYFATCRYLHFKIRCVNTKKNWKK